MTVIDFIEVSDDFIDLTSDEETVQQDNIATQPQASLVDRQAVSVLADEGKQDGQASFASAGEGSREATESGNASVATTSPSVMEKVPLDMAESQNCPSSPTSAPLASPACATPKVLSSEVGDPKQDVFVLAGEGSQDAQTAFVSAGEGSQEDTESANALVATALPSAMEKVPLDTAESKSCPNSPTSAPLPSPASITLKDVTSEDGDTQLGATVSPSGMEKPLLDTAESMNCPTSASTPLHSLVSTTPKVLTSEDGDTQLGATIAPSGMEKALLDTAESKNCLTSPASAPLPSLASTTPKAPTSEDGGTKLARAKHPKKNYHTSTPRRSPRLRECCNNPVEELTTSHKRSRMLKPAEELDAASDNAESTKTFSTDNAN
ncbi:mucin-1-like [Lolium rigidum]|uniref:mucin-1-like n=1 Tax=Lolium rigidum TaxID=89674 RepID=UPI001F5D6EAF|nr:mucin-1-like [Lolium rigidum]XP_047059878.1 mucin-1-like [Lolium rigidum]